MSLHCIMHQYQVSCWLFFNIFSCLVSSFSHSNQFLPSLKICLNHSYFLAVHALSSFTHCREMVLFYNCDKICLKLDTYVVHVYTHIFHIFVSLVIQLAYWLYFSGTCYSQFSFLQCPRCYQCLHLKYFELLSSTELKFLLHDKYLLLSAGLILFTAICFVQSPLSHHRRVSPWWGNL